MFPLFATGVKFAAGVVDTGGNLPPVSSCHRCHLATSVIDTGGKFAAGVVDTGGKFAAVINNSSSIVGKFAAAVVDTGGAP